MEDETRLDCTKIAWSLITELLKSGERRGDNLVQEK